MIYPSTNELLRFFVGSVLLGACFCLIYDLLRISRFLVGIGDVPSFRSVLPFPRGMSFRFSPSSGLSGFLINLGDILFFLLCGVTFVVYLSVANHGRVRWLALVGLGGGFLLCRATLSVLVLRCAGLAAEIMRFLLAWVIWVILRPICLLFRICRRAGGLVKCALFSLWIPLYTRWKMKRCFEQLKRFYHQKRRMHDGTT